ncbi:Bacterial type II/III secretion system short domain protein [Stieleria maiorica]|uniref:Bacterial type II/III secretion system short domain protein n=1 Tax=Stieleria maiorica TaxID=2795974 RepID=A0A5B9M999_9BACT|nr:secretin N-terminal domain-containing protein [Stieleria maiorica]QEF96776.1 Bacterial type II/III secretion system short domain protein [Stieleria maiorica]
MPRRRNSLPKLTLLVLLPLALPAFHSFAPEICAQGPTVTVVGPDGKPRTMPAPGSPPGAAPGTPNAKPGEKSEPGKPGEKNGDAKAEKPPEPKVIRRGDQESGDADPEELKATVGADGKVAFQFRNQPWIELIQWLAEIADQPLDWQELPADRVNLRSPGRYTVDETKDLFNRHLLARGYTLLEMPGGITVAKTEGINPAMVPRVSVDQLTELMPHTFVRASLELGWLSSEKMAEELKPMISSNGRLTALTTTNRIEAMDAAINLRQVAALLEQERNQSSRDALAPEFRLRYIPAETAKQMLEEFLGVEKKSNAPMTPQQMAMMQQMARQNGGQPPPAAKKPEISIVANTRQNSVFIRAPVDRIAIATEFINRIDVPGQSLTSLSDIESRLQVFRLSTIDPEKLIEIIGEMNVLEPSTQIRADETNKALIVSGSAADRYIIDRLIERLDGSGRQFEVLQLRRLEATEVAESISFLMGKDKDDDNQSNSRRYYYYGYGNQQEDAKDEDEFRVAANSRFRQVLLWANESEMEQVRNLLIKLGELPPPGGSARTVRRIDASSAPETYQYLLRLKQQWAQLSDAPLELPDASEFVDPIARDEQDTSEEEDQESTDVDVNLETRHESPGAPESSLPEEKAVTRLSKNGERLTATETDTASESEPQTPADPSPRTSPIQSAKDFDRLFGNRGADGSQKPSPSDSAANDTASDPPPIQIQLDEDGNLLLLGSDTKALDRLENLMLQVTPPKRPYHVFKIKHQTAGYIQLNLEEYFEDKEEEEDSDSFYRYFFYDFNDSSDDGPKGLEKNNELRFVYDPDTNTIVVSGATSSQLRTISELIELWDVAEPVNKRRMRYTKLVNVEFGSAETIAETVKEAYRDLLSSNDKTFAKGGRGGGGGGGAPGGEEKNSGRERQGSGLVDGDNGRDGGDVDFSFKGKLSMGVDMVGNTLLVSAEGEPLLDLVVEMIHKLDLAAKPAGDMQIISLSGNTSEKSIQNVLKAFGGNGASESTPPQTPPRPGTPPTNNRDPQ